MRDMRGTGDIVLGGAELVELPLTSRHHAAIGNAGLIASRPTAVYRERTSGRVVRNRWGGRLPTSQRMALRFIAPI